MKKPRYWRQGERLRAIFFLTLGFILLWGIIDLFTTVGVVDADTLMGVMGATSAAFETNPIANIHLLPRVIAIGFTIVPAMLHPLAGYLFILLASIMFIISGIRDLLKPL